MRIILFTDNLGGGGAQRQLVGLAALLKNRGYEVIVCYYQDNPFFLSYLYENNIQYEQILGADSHYKRILLVKKYFRKKKADWVIAYQETPSLIACICKLLGGSFRLIVSERSTTQVLDARTKLRFLLYKFTNYIVPNSYSQASFIMNNYKNLFGKVRVITNFVDLNKFIPVDNYKARSTVPIILVAASILPHKNLHRLIHAVDILRKEQIKFEIRWYGLLKTKTNGIEEYQNYCIDLINRLGLVEYIKLYPKSPNIIELYKKADYFCLPSLFEGTPNVICEAMASGLPIICSDVCDNPRYVSNKNGFLFNPINYNAIAAAIKSALTINESAYHSLAVNSRKIAEELLSEEVFVNKYLNLIHEK